MWANISTSKKKCLNGFLVWRLTVNSLEEKANGMFTFWLMTWKDTGSVSREFSDRTNVANVSKKDKSHDSIRNYFLVWLQRKMTASLNYSENWSKLHNNFECSENILRFCYKWMKISFKYTTCNVLENLCLHTNTCSWVANKIIKALLNDTSKEQTLNCLVTAL